MREGRELSASIICDERCGERRVLLGGVTKFHERVSPLRPAFARECEEEETTARTRARERDKNVLGSALLTARAREREIKEREGRVRKRDEGTAERTRAEDGERDIPRAGEENGSGAE